MGLELALQGIIFIFSAAVLIKSSEWVVRHAAHLSGLFGVSAFAVGFIIISIATSLPELAVVIFSSVNGVPGMGIGGVMGSNLSDLTIVLGITAILAGPIILKRKEIIGLVELLFITSLVTVLIFQSKQLTQLHGIVLLALFVYLLFTLYKKGKVPRDVFDGVTEKKRTAVFKLSGSLGLLVIAAYFAVSSATAIADELAISATLIGATLVALSTSLPELAVELRAVKNKQYALALGDLFGSAVTNVTLVLGTLALLSAGSAKIDISPLVGILPIFFVTLFFIWYSLSKQGKITKNEGFILCGLYALFLVQEFELLAFLG